MPDDPKNPDSLDDDRTFTGERDVPSQQEQTLGDQVTRGDATTSSPDEFKQILDDGNFGEIVDLETRYQESEQLGAGGQGKVLKVIDKRLGRTVALKFLLEEFADSPQALARFMTEAKAIATLNHHNIVQIFDMERSAEGPYLVMEYVSGGSLLDRLQKGALEVEDAVSITCQLCDALTLAHQKGIIHRDIKPANILMTEDGIPKLTDFGLARQQAADHGQTAVGAIMGTIDFMPPEQRRDSTSVDERSDLWSLAAVFYQLVTGKSPKVIRIDQLPPNLAPVVGKMLEEEPAERYSSAEEFKSELQKAVASTSVAIVADLADGVCPACNTANDTTRKFCKGCRARLLEACLSCEKDSPVWEDVCGECGSSQAELKESILKEFQDKINSAEELLGKFEFDKATTELQPVVIAEFEFATELIDAAGDLSARITQQRDTQYALRSELEKLAREQIDAFDYAAAQQTLSQLPSVLHDDEFASLLHTARHKYTRKVELGNEIKLALKNRAYGGLLEKTQEYLELKPNAENAKMLMQKLLAMPQENSIGMQLRIIPAGSFTQIQVALPERDYINPFTNKPAHYPARPGWQRKVVISKSFYMQTTTVTQEQWKSIMSSEPWKGQSGVEAGVNYPATFMSWNDAVEFCEKLSAKERKTYRLPTEAEWEQACQADATTDYHFGDSILNELQQYAWFDVNAGARLHEVGLKKPNDFGLYDMHGNVHEFCSDWVALLDSDTHVASKFDDFGSDSDSGTREPITDPTGPSTGIIRAMKGGSWESFSDGCEKGERFFSDDPNHETGFRVVLELE